MLKSLEIQHLQNQQSQQKNSSLFHRFLSVAKIHHPLFLLYGGKLLQTKLSCVVPA